MRRGFTLIELLLVLVILAVLAVIVVPKFAGLNHTSTFLYGAVWVLSVFAAATALHLSVERPFLALRARFVAYRRPEAPPRPLSQASRVRAAAEPVRPA